MGLFSLRGLTYKSHFRDNRFLISTLLLAAPILAVLFYAYQSFYYGRPNWSHSHNITAPFTPDLNSTSLLYVASYSGVITTLNLSLAGYRDAPIALETVATMDGCAGSPSWLTLDSFNSVLYCTDEGLQDGKNGSLASFNVSQDGSLTPLDKVSTVIGPVSAVLFGDYGRGLAMAHYGGSAFTTWNVSDPANITSVQVQRLTLSKPGPDPSRQEAPHPHAAVVDPSGQFILIPDLGADLIRVYRVDAEGLNLTELNPIVVAPGSGPRHLAFAVKQTKTFMYVVTELGNTILGYQVAYGGGFMIFKEIWSSGVHGEGKAIPSGAATAELVVSPDKEFLIISSRNESTHEIPRFDTKNSTTIVSDPLISFEIDAETGHLALQQDVPCGGRFPRHFSINTAGTLVAVALQSDSRVALIERDAKTGMLGDFVAYADLDGEVTAVIFYE
ncbi:hypothetical protein F66182_7203 [Fusarium sp. NRRL 66182]|nr:hypothetical protein F66182_7203 [Fusarium sp. NRRL 66182]